MALSPLAQQVAGTLRALMERTLAPNGLPWADKGNGSRRLAAAIKEHNGGTGPSYQTLLNLLDGTIMTPLPGTLLPIARFFGATLADFGLEEDSDTKLLQLLDRAPHLRAIALKLADLPDEVVDRFEQQLLHVDLAASQLDGPVSPAAYEEVSDS